MNNRSRMHAPAAGKENAVVNSTRHSRAASSTTASHKIMAPPQQHQAQVPKTPTIQAAGTNADSTKKHNAVGRSGRGAGLSLRADGNGGAPSSVLRGTAAAAAAGDHTHEGESSVGTSSSSLDSSSTSSDFTGPQRVRVGNNSIASDISLSFWSLPASIPDAKSRGRPDSTTTLRAALSARAPAETNAPVHRSNPQRPASRESSAAGGAAVDGGGSGGADVTESRSRKRGRTEAAPPPATTTAAATSAEAREQALKWRSGVSASGRHGDGGSISRDDEPEERVAKDRRVAATVKAPASGSSSSSSSSNPAADSARPKKPFGTDISHILSWKPAPRPDSAGPGTARTGTATTAVAPGGAAAVAERVKGKDEGGGGSTAAHATARRQKQEQQRSNRGGVTKSSKESAAPGATAGRSSAVHPPSGAAAGVYDLLRSGHAHGAAPVPTSTAARSKMTTSSLEALRVRVVKKGDDKGGDRRGERSGGDIGDDDSEDSFEVDLKLEAYDEAIRRRSSADATSAPPRPGAMGSRSSSVPAAAAPPVLRPPSSAAAEGASGLLAPAPAALASKTAPKGGSETASSGLSEESVVAGGGEGGHGPGLAAAAAVAAAAAARGAIGETAMGGPARVSKTSHERGSSSGGGVVWGNRGGLGTAEAGAVASVMSRVPEEGEEAMSLTIGSGSRAPFPAPADSNFSAGVRYASTFVGGGGGDVGSGALHTSGTATGGRTDPSLSLGSEQTDSSNQASGVSTGVGGGGGGAGYERAGAFGSGLLGGGSTGGSSLSVAPVGEKPDKSVAIAQGVRGHGLSEVMVNGVCYLKTAKIGRGGSSEVFRVVAPDCEMMALKVVKVDNRVENAQALIDSYSNEIQLLKKLQGNRYIITLENSEVDRHRGLISIVLELGETDLDRLMRQKKANVASTRVEAATLGLFPGGLDANFVRVIWQQMINAVQAMHDQRVVHGDLKPANFVFVKGSLKLIDFGIAKAISNDTVNISRDSRLGTINYMCPEAFEDTGNGDLDPATGRQTPVIKQGRPSDIWSLGCILYQMSHGKTPFSHLSMVPKIRAITNPAHAIAIADLKDEHLADTLRACLKRDPSERATIGGAGGLLSHPYLDPIAARAALETALNAKLAAAHEGAEARINAAESRADARIAELEREVDARIIRRVAAVERDIHSRHEGAVASAVKEAVAAEQARQAAGLSIAKSALKHIIATTVRVLNADKSVNLDRADIDRITGLVIEMGRNGGAPTAGIRQ